MTDTPAPIATPEEVALRIVEANSDGDSFTDNKAWLNKDGMVLAIAAALTSSNAEIERLKERLRSAEATVDTFMRAQEHYREAMDERNTFKNAARAAEASALTAKRDGMIEAADEAARLGAHGIAAAIRTRAASLTEGAETRKTLTRPPERPELERLLREAAKITMTPAQAREQRKSWVRGQIGLAHPELDEAELRRRVDAADEEIYGPLPADAPHTETRGDG